MPDGVVKWCDMKTGEAEIVRGGRLFPARAADMEPVARRAGARVHFDIRRVHGTEQAIDVRLRAGSRVSHHQHRFVTLAGARRVDTKGPAPYAHTHPEIHRARTHPLEVARAWSTNVAQGDVSSAFALYSPDAKVHIGDRSLTGRSEVQAWLEANPLLGSARHAKIRGGEQVYGPDAAAVVSWEAIGQGEPGLVIKCRIAHGQIAEQWVSEPEPPSAMLPQGRTGPLPVALTAKGDVGEDDKVHAERMILQVIERLKEPVLFARLKLVREPDPARLRPVRAQVTLDVDGDVVRAQAAAASVPEATDMLMRRLHDRLEHRARHREFLHRSDALAEPGEWRHGDLPTVRPAYFDRPVEDRQLVRHKTFAIGELTPDEAVFDMEQLDYDFYLFCDLASGSDAIIERVDNGSYRLTRSAPLSIDPGPTAARIEVSGTDVPVLSLSDVIERLDVGVEPHIFFANATTGRGNVLYRRYDGHYGLIVSE
jgi:hypothetical protein